MKKLISGLLALAWFAFAAPTLAQAGEGSVIYKPGVVKAAIAKGQTALIFYKSTW